MVLIFGYGYLANRVEPRANALELVKFLIGEEVSCLLFDFRAWGNSEGNMTTLGYYEKNDMQGAVDWVNRFFYGWCYCIISSSGGRVCGNCDCRQSI